MNVSHSLVCMPCHNFQGPGKQEPGISQLLCWELALTLSMAYDMGIPPKMERASQIGQPKIGKSLLHFHLDISPGLSILNFFSPLTFCHSCFDSPPHLVNRTTAYHRPRQLKAMEKVNAIDQRVFYLFLVNPISTMVHP